MRGLMYRVFLTCINIIFPPLAIMILCGAEWDCMLNCAFFVLAVIPSHIHGFYLTCTYFHRRNKVRKGRYPGGPKHMVHSPIILNGGASDAEVQRLWRKENGVSRRSSRRQSGGSLQQLSNPNAAAVQRQNSDINRANSNRRRPSNHESFPHRQQDMVDAHQVMRDGYGPHIDRTTSLRAGLQGPGHSSLSPVDTRISQRLRW